MPRGLATANYWEGSANRPEIIMVAAVGISGQLGLNGVMPWHGDKSMKELLRRDLRFFQEITKESVVVVGRNTWPTVDMLDGTHGRLFLIDGANTYVRSSDGYLAEQEWSFNIPVQAAFVGWHEGRRDRNRVVIAGGAKTYRKWMPYVDEIYLSHIGYDGLADTYFPYDAMTKEQQDNIIVPVDYAADTIVEKVNAYAKKATFIRRFLSFGS